MTTPIRNRIKAHRRVRAGELVPHEWNFRAHPEEQRRALEALYRQVGFARSLLAYELPDGRLKLIDGHLRRDIDPDMEVEVEVLDVTEEEAHQLLVSIDPMAQLAEMQTQLYDRLRETAPEVDPELRAMWEKAARQCLEEEPPRHFRLMRQDVPAQFMVLLTCRDEKHQIELLARFQAEGLECKALLS